MHGYQVHRLDVGSEKGRDFARVRLVAAILRASEPAARCQGKRKARRIPAGLVLRYSESAVCATACCCDMDGAVRILRALSGHGRQAESGVVTARETHARVACPAACSSGPTCACNGVSLRAASPPVRGIGQLSPALRRLTASPSPPREQKGRAQSPRAIRPKNIASAHPVLLWHLQTIQQHACRALSRLVAWSIRGSEPDSRTPSRQKRRRTLRILMDQAGAEHGKAARPLTAGAATGDYWNDRPVRHKSNAPAVVPALASI
jgi:hypothetical protein